MYFILIKMNLLIVTIIIISLIFDENVLMKQNTSYSLITVILKIKKINLIFVLFVQQRALTRVFNLKNNKGASRPSLSCEEIVDLSSYSCEGNSKDYFTVEY